MSMLDKIFIISFSGLSFRCHGFLFLFDISVCCLCLFSSRAIMSDKGERTCPLCAEEMDLTDQQLKPCKCGYEV